MSRAAERLADRERRREEREAEHTCHIWLPKVDNITYWDGDDGKYSELRYSVSFSVKFLVLEASLIFVMFEFGCGALPWRLTSCALAPTLAIAPICRHLR